MRLMWHSAQSYLYLNRVLLVHGVEIKPAVPQVAKEEVVIRPCFQRKRSRIPIRVKAPTQDSRNQTSPSLLEEENSNAVLPAFSGMPESTFHPEHTTAAIPQHRYSRKSVCVPLNSLFLFNNGREFIQYYYTKPNLITWQRAEWHHVKMQTTSLITQWTIVAVTESTASYVLINLGYTNSFVMVRIMVM